MRYPLNVPVSFVPVKRDKRRKYAYPCVLRTAPRVYWLIYDKRQKTGTGGFDSAIKAMRWYNNGGR